METTATKTRTGKLTYTVVYHDPRKPVRCVAPVREHTYADGRTCLEYLPTHHGCPDGWLAVSEDLAAGIKWD